MENVNKIYENNETKTKWPETAQSIMVKEHL